MTTILDQIVDEIGLLIEERDYYKEEYEAAQELLSKEFADGHIHDTGPTRPNRRKLSLQEVKDIRQAFQGGMKQVDLADNYGVNPATISRIVRGIYY
jgi:DNA-binding transcriptional regulator YiaG